MYDEIYGDEFNRLPRRFRSDTDDERKQKVRKAMTYVLAGIFPPGARQFAAAAGQAGPGADPIGAPASRLSPGRAEKDGRNGNYIRSFRRKPESRASGHGFAAPGPRLSPGRAEKERGTDSRRPSLPRARPSEAHFDTFREARRDLARLVRAGRLHDDGMKEYGGNYHQNSNGKWGYTVKRGRNDESLSPARMKAVPSGVRVRRLWHTHPRANASAEDVSQAIAREGNEFIYHLIDGDVAVVRRHKLPMEIWTPSGRIKLVRPGNIEELAKHYDHNKLLTNGGRFSIRRADKKWMLPGLRAKIENAGSWR